jgi:hypothetical protein
MIETYRVCNCGGGEFVFRGEMIHAGVYAFSLEVEDSCCGCVMELSPREVEELETDEADDYALERADSGHADTTRPAPAGAREEGGDDVQRLTTRLRAAILDIDAHATGYGVGDDDAIHHYIVSAGALHRALGLVGHTAPKQPNAATHDRRQHRRASRDVSIGRSVDGGNMHDDNPVTTELSAERRAEIETILDLMTYSWAPRESDAIRDLFAAYDAAIARADNAEWDAARNRTLIDGHQMRHDALVETMQRVGAQLEAAERVVRASRGAVQAGTGRPMTVNECARLMDALDAYDATTRPAPADGAVGR